MRKTTKFLTLVLAVIMVASMFVTGSSAAFEDVDYTSAEGEAVGLLVSLGVAKGTTETKFGTDELVTRQQMAAFIYRLMKAGRQEPTTGGNTTKFTDIEDAYYNYTISWANQTGIIKGVSETRFNPKGNITLQDAYVMIIRALEYEKNGALSYPFGYTEKAEEIGLDEDLPSTLNYTDALTRGNVAVLLKNAFYADMATYEIVYVSGEPTLVYRDGGLKGPASEDDEIVSAVAGTSRPENRYDTVASKIFGVEKITEYVVATPSYSFGDKDNTSDTDEAVIEFGDLGRFTAESDKDEINVNDYFVGTATFSELGLEGEADDYFMAGIELFIKKDDNGDKTILGANSLLNKKTVKGENVVIGTATGSSEAKYYDNDPDVDEENGETYKKYKRMNGLLTIDGVKTYIYDAPYSYAKPDSFTKAAINEYNAQFITLGAYEGDVASLEDEEPVEEIYKYDLDGNMNLSYNYEDGTADERLADNSDAFLEVFSQAYYGGFYELEVYDVDSDGLYDFINYKPYSVAIVDDEEDAYLSDSGFDEELKLYVDKSIIKGEKAENDDVVIAYVNADANYAEIKAVVEGTETRINSTTNDYARFASGEKHIFAHANEVLANAKDLENKDALALSTEGTFYFYDGKLVYTDDVATKFDYNSDWVVVLKDTSEEIRHYEGTKIERYEAIDIYHDGELKSVKAKKITEDMRKLDSNNQPTKYKYSPVTEVNAEGRYDYTDYVGKLAVAKTDSKGAYYFELAEALYDDRNDATILKDKNEDGEYMYTTDSSNLTKYRNSVYKLSDKGEATFTGVYVKDYTQIIIRSVDKDDEEIFTVYGIDDLPDFDEDQEFSNVTVVIANNKNSTAYENLVVFYGEARGADGELVEIDEAKGKTVDYRIVLTGEYAEDEDGDPLNTYRVINPFTGTIEDVEGYNSEDTLAKGSIHAMLSSGKLDDDAAESYGNAYSPAKAGYEVDLDDVKDSEKQGNLGYVEIEEYDEDSGIITLVANYDYTLNATKDTKVYFSDKSDASLVKKELSDLASTSKNLRQGDNKDNNLRAFIIAEKNDKDSDGDDLFYDATVVIIVRD